MEGVIIVFVEGANFKPEKGIQGKQFVIGLFVFILVFAGVFGFGTYGLGQLMSPYFKSGPQAERDAIETMHQRELSHAQRDPAAHAR